jgi:protein involved in polysaccharide export with SLBB domain
MRSPFTALLMLLFLIIISPHFTTQAQSLPDVSSLNVDELTDAQIMDLMKRATSMGYSEDDFLVMAKAQGLPAAELAKLSKRVNQIKSARVAQSQAIVGSRDRKQQEWDDIIKRRQQALEQHNAKPMEDRIFGLNIFGSAQGISFDPSMNMATPKNYVVGPGDELFIDIYGASEQYYEAKINADGKLLLQNIGPIAVNGFTIEQATQRIKSRLSTVYTGMSGANPNTFVQVSLGSLRTIKVNIVGEVKMPGTFSVSSLASVFNALYLAGGPTANGTLREIKVFRNNKLISTIDAYEFLLNGKTSTNISLEDQDVIIINPFISRVEVEGEVKRPGIFEIKGNETFVDLLNYAGGFTDNAYKDRISVTRNTNTEKIVSDIFANQFELFNPKGGDSYYIGQLLNRFQNRVQIKGAVFREGNYAITEGLTVGELIKRADGLRGDAFLKRALIIRTKDDLTTQTIAFDLGELLKGNVADIKLERDDVLTISSLYDTREEFYVKITGEVNNGGAFPYSQSMTVEDLILMAKGLRESASEANIEIARRVKDQNTKDISDIILLKVNKDLSLNADASKITLEPFDHIIVRPNPNFRTEKFIKVEGEVFFPGDYAIKNVNERISDVIKRAGGLNEFSYAKGATLIRYTEFFEKDSELDKKRQNLAKVLRRLDNDNINLTESERMFLDRLDQKLFESEYSTEDESDYASFAKKERLAEISKRNTMFADVNIRETEAIGINLEEIMKTPGSKYDLILEEGDIISIPKQLQTVRMRGRLLYPTTVRYESSRSLKYFVNNAGGFDNRAKRRHTYVVYANGEVARTKNLLFIKSYPSVEPGAEVIVPAKPPKVPMSTGDIVGISTGLATLLLVLTQINFSSGN